MAGCRGRHPLRRYPHFVTFFCIDTFALYIVPQRDERLFTTLDTIHMIATISIIGLKMTRHRNPNAAPIAPKTMPSTVPRKLNRQDTTSMHTKIIRTILNHGFMNINLLSATTPALRAPPPRRGIISVSVFHEIYDTTQDHGAIIAY